MYLADMVRVSLLDQFSICAGHPISSMVNRVKKRLPGLR
jgi:hypothetical protein